MTPKEKAKRLYDSFVLQVRWKLGQEDYKDKAKKCALIAVNEILNALSYKVSCNLEELKYYEEVKQEIEKL